MHGDALIVTLVSLWFVYTCTLIIIVWAVFYTCRALRCHWCSTALQGPPDKGESVASCAARYGPVFSVPVRLWTRKVVLCDPRAITHFYANAAGIYRLDPGTRKITENLVGRGLTWVDGADHSGHKQALAPFFSASAVAGYFPAFCDTVAKVYNKWGSALESQPLGIVVEAHHWTTSIVLDALGVACFNHNFDALSGNYNVVIAAFFALRLPADWLFTQALKHPWLLRIPSAKHKVLKNFEGYVDRMADDILNGYEKQDTCMMSSLIDSLARHPAGEFRLSKAEVLAQIKTILFSGLETTSVTLSWLLVELARNTAVQNRLRSELGTLRGKLDPETLSSLPYLQSVVSEGLRFHPPITETVRVAAEDDVIPLSAPIVTKSGESVTSIRVAKGTAVAAPLAFLNSAPALWGPDAHRFDPDRWWLLQDAPGFPGGMHLAHGDGPRMCLGAEMSGVLIKAGVAPAAAHAPP